MMNFSIFDCLGYNLGPLDDKWKGFYYSSTGFGQTRSRYSDEKHKIRLSQVSRARTVHKFSSVYRYEEPTKSETKRNLWKLIFNNNNNKLESSDCRMLSDSIFNLFGGCWGPYFDIGSFFGSVHKSRWHYSLENLSIVQRYVFSSSSDGLRGSYSGLCAWLIKVTFCLSAELWAEKELWPIDSFFSPCLFTKTLTSMVPSATMQYSKLLWINIKKLYFRCQNVLHCL